MDINTILFDLDGTLLPMDQEKFVNGYFKMLAAKLVPYGYEPQQLINAILAGIEAMIKNDRRQLNEDAFWKRFVDIYGDKVLADKPVFEDFYKNEFQDARSFCGFNPKAAETVRLLKDKGYRVVLATNPLFPSIATESRIRWARLEPSEFDLYTTYENTSYCKPNLDYYRDILKRIDCRPEECLMVGNDVGEDMVVEALGLQVFLLTDCLINTQKKDITAYPHGSFEQLLSML